MGYQHKRVKSNGHLFYKNNTGTSILVVLLSGVILGLASLLNYIPIVGSVAYMLAVPVFSMSIMNWFRRSIPQPLSVGNMFDSFKDNFAGKFGTMILTAVYTYLWSLLFIIPGIIKGYSYSMTQYIKDENPNIPASEAIKLSMTMTKGHKGDLFYLDLSFIGWYILGSLTCGILDVVYVVPYHNAAKAFAYEELKAEAIQTGKIPESVFYSSAEMSYQQYDNGYAANFDTSYSYNSQNNYNSNDNVDISYNNNTQAEQSSDGVNLNKEDNNTIHID